MFEAFWNSGYWLKHLICFFSLYAADATMRPDYTSGQVYTIMLVSSFFQAGCPGKIHK